jgi:hypothetical protein
MLPFVELSVIFGALMPAARTSEIEDHELICTRLLPVTGAPSETDWLLLVAESVTS